MKYQDRSRAESFGASAERYDRSRPTYPAGVLDAVLGAEPGGLDVLDVGCGTGIAARQMVACGARVLGVEVDGRMADVARRHGIAVEVDRFETWDPGARTFDVVTAGQAWHWVDPRLGPAKAARVLRPGGKLAVFWNVGRPPADLAAALDEVYAALAPGADACSVLLGHSSIDDYAVERDGMRQCDRLAEPAAVTFPWHRTYTREEWLDQLPTHSDHAALPPADRDRLLAAVGDVIDGFGGRFTMRYETVLITAERL